MTRLAAAILPAALILLLVSYAGAAEEVFGARYPALSPDGEWVLYTRTERDLDSEQLDSTTHVWRVGIDGSAARQLTRGEDSATAPACM